MKKKSLFGALICSAVLAVTSILPSAVMADATKVVTLGADLSDSQKSTMLKYFKVNKDEIQILYVTNSDERRYLSSYVPSAQIGTRTVSCAYVKPTSSGGIKVRTANLNYVTCNMIATTLSTSGVSNCEVVAACPFEVSGTGALTGIMMAYEHATGQELDSTKKDIATREMVVTGNLAQSIESDKEAINLINSGKMEVVENNIQNTEEIYNVVVNIANENNIQVNQEQLDEIVSLLQDIADQGYDYEDMRETLENVEENVNEDLTPTDEPTGEEGDDELQTAGDEEDEEDEDSILNDLDPSALGDGVFESSTEDPSLAVDTAPQEENPESPEPENEDWGEIDWNESDWNEGDWDEGDWDENTDGWDEQIDGSDEGENTDWDNEEIDGWEDPSDWEEPDEEDWGSEPEEVSGDDGVAVIDDNGSEENGTEESEEDILASLDDTERGMYDHLVTFCKGEFEGDVLSLQFETDEDTYPTVVLEKEISEKLTKEVLKFYLKLLKDGTDDYFPSEMDSYLTPELNILEKTLKEIMNLEGYAEPGSYMEEVSSADRQTLYADTMKFFEKLYNETPEDVESWNEEDSYGDSYDESYEDSYDDSYEEGYDDSYEESYDEVYEDGEY